MHCRRRVADWDEAALTKCSEMCPMRVFTAYEGSGVERHKDLSLMRGAQLSCEMDTLESIVSYSSVYALLFAQPELEGCRPALNVFTEEHTTKVPEHYYSRYWNQSSELMHSRTARRLSQMHPRCCCILTFPLTYSVSCNRPWRNGPTAS